LSNLVIFLGPPGAGKGTQAAKIAKEKNFAHISTGDMLREHVSSGTELGNTAKTLLDEGKLVPDSLVIEMLIERLNSDDCKNGAILDGFPRTIPQAVGLSKIFQSLSQAIDGIINIEVDKDVLIKRLVERAKNSGRADDTEEVIINRQNVYSELTAPLIEFYQSDIINIDGDGSIEKVTERILKRIH